ncbi:MAG: thiolase domain-containing protein [Polyangiaceae bacterium]|nr:thiolase domain-containing protein [Polyangiaceae bacterium]
MSEVFAVGIGQTEVGEHWDRSLRQLGAAAARAALADAGTDRVDALYVGNMLAGDLSGQHHLGPLIAEHAGLLGIEAVAVEAACGSGGAAFRTAFLAVASGHVEAALVVGVEKMTDRPGKEVTQGLVTAADADFESQIGLSFVAINALLMRRYLLEHRVSRDDFAPFIVNAHANAVHNPMAMYRFAVSAAEFSRQAMVADPISVLDSSPVCDGAAAVLLCSRDRARGLGRNAARVRACTVGTDTIALHDRRDPLELAAAVRSSRRAYELAGIQPRDIDLFEAHDAFSIMTALSLEAAGFAERGRGVAFGASGAIAIDGDLPLSTMGGLKARGHPVGATGVYQIAEVLLQLRGEAGQNQVKNATLGMAQNIGGSGATVVTTVLEAVR